MNIRITKPILMCCVALFCISCTGGTNLLVQHNDSNISPDIYRVDTTVFQKENITQQIDKTIYTQDYPGASEYLQSYTLTTYQNMDNFSSLYENEQLFQRMEIPVDPDYTFTYAKIYRNYLYFLAVTDEIGRIFRYNLDDGTTEEIFTYQGENQITLGAVSNDYLIWREDENANWLKESINCYSLKTKTNEKIYTHPRNPETGYMDSWNFDPIVLNGDSVYFSSRVGETNRKSDIDLYRYDISTKELTTVATKRAAHPLHYHGISWLSYDDEAGEYLLKNSNPDYAPIYIGSEYIEFESSQNSLAGCINEGHERILFFDGEKTYPIIETTNNFEDVRCSDTIIAWNGWSHDYPIYYDITKESLVYVDVLEADRQYKPYLSDEYLVFSANKYVPDPELGGDAITTEAFIYYYVKIDDLMK